jgi:hypothetical protein
MFAHEIKTNEQAIEAWRDYQAIWTIEMGGMGPNYELAIQNLAFSILETWIENKMKIDDGDELDFLTKPIIEKLNDSYGYSGAQVGAAVNIASVFLRHGYEKAIAMEEVKDRKILYTNTLPKEEK